MRTSGLVPQLALAAGLMLLATRPAGARTSGIVGYSGIDGISCNNSACHSPDQETAVPTVRFEGPAELDPGAVGSFRFVVTSQAPELQIQAGFNVAAAAGTLIAVQGQRTKLQLDPVSRRSELTHTGPKDNDEAAEAAWEFQWRAPESAGEYVLWGAGNSVDASSTNGGDASAVAMLVIAVGDVAPTPTPTPTPLPEVCTGDCNRDGVVAVNELISGVNIALGSATVEVCTPCDANGDGRVSISELVNAVSRLLNGC